MQQRVFFNGQMALVEDVAETLRENGRSTDFIFRHLGFKLGFMPEEQEIVAPESPVIFERFSRSTGA